MPSQYDETNYTFVSKISLRLRYFFHLISINEATIHLINHLISGRQF